MGLAALGAALALAASPVQFVQAHAQGGAFAEPGQQASVSLTAWAVLGLRSAGASAPGALAYLRSQEQTLESPTDVALVALAEQALGADTTSLRAKLQPAASGAIGGTLNATFWGVLADGRAGVATRRYIIAHQARSGGFSWVAGGQPDSNDTSAALEALRVAGVHGAPVRRAVRFLLGCENRRDGGFELTKGRASDAQSTAWAIQGLVAAGAKPPRAAFRYLASLRRPDGSFRYSKQYAPTPVWVTSQVLAALARKPFPLR